MKSQKRSDTTHTRASRRKFTKAVVAAAVAAAPLASLATNAQQPPAGKTKEAPAPPNPQPSPTPQQPSPIAEAYAQVTRARFGEQVTPEQLEQIKKDLQFNVTISDLLRAAKLQNGDEPDFTFIA